MVLTNKYTETLIHKFPNFAKSVSLKDAIELFSDDEKVDAYTIFIGLTHYVTNELININNDISQEEKEIYELVEDIREKYSGYLKPSPEFDIDNAACTCFLENLLNIASSNEIDYSRFIPYLGEKSKEYCRAWDEFTGVKSPGLW